MSEAVPGRGMMRVSLQVNSIKYKKMDSQMRIKKCFIKHKHSIRTEFVLQIRRLFKIMTTFTFLWKKEENFDDNVFQSLF